MLANKAVPPAGSSRKYPPLTGRERAINLTEGDPDAMAEQSQGQNQSNKG